MTPFVRHPAPGEPAREVLVEVGDSALSGLLAEPAGGEPRALLMAVHGAGMHAGYFHTATAPGLSLLELGSRLGFSVWAPDRPGIGASADLPDDRISLFPQASLLLDALDAFAADHPVGGGVVLVGHSYGLKVALAMAAEPRGSRLLGIDGAGSGIRFAAFDGDGKPVQPPTRRGERGPAWGPATIYPRGTFRRASLPLAPLPPVQLSESGRWPDDFRSFAGRIRIPVRLTFGEHEGYWSLDESHFDELRAVLAHVPSLAMEIEPHAGHNISLGWVARGYHLKVVAFAERCLLAGRVPDGRGRQAS